MRKTLILFSLALLNNQFSLADGDGQANVAISPASNPESSSVASSGYVAYIDLNTGQLLYGPPPGSPTTMPLDVETQMQLSTSSVGLHSEHNIKGGYAMDLQGRFRHSTMITINPSTGESKYFCVGNQPVFDAETGQPVNLIE